MKLQFGLCLIFVIAEVFSDGTSDSSASNNSKNKEATGIPHFHLIGEDGSDNESDSHEHNQQSVFNLLIESFYPPDPSQSETLDPNATTEAANQNVNGLPSTGNKQPNKGIPEIEMEKLKSAAKNAGLSKAKADRVARAAEAMEMQYNDIVELRKMLNNPATSAEYADKVRRALEDAVIEQALKKNAQINSNEINSEPNPPASVNEPTQNQQFQQIEKEPTDPLKHPANQSGGRPVAVSPFDRQFQTLTIFPAPEAFLEAFPFPPLPPLFKAFALPPGIFGTNLAEKSPLLDLWKAASPVIGQKEAYRLTLVCHNLGLTKEEVLDLQHLFSDPTITKEKGLQILSTYESRLNDASKAKLSTPNLDPVTLQSLKSIAKMSGLDEQSANRLVRAVIDADLDSNHVMKFSRAIQDNAPSDTDLKKITDHIEADIKKKAEQKDSSSNSDSEPAVSDGEYEKEWTNNDQLKGAEWIFSSTKGTDVSDSPSSKTTRALNFQGKLPENNLRLFVARRFCGFSPIVEPSRLSNTSPGQYPWTGVVLSSRGDFLCGATLLSESIVICPASCIIKYNQETQNQQPVKVVFGWSMFEGPECHFPSLEIFVSSALVHPLATGSFVDVANGENNIALLRLSKNIDFDIYPHIFPICSIGPSVEQYAGTNNCRVLYWPHLPNMESWRPRTYLTSAEVTVSKNQNCGGPGTSFCVTGQVCAANAGSPVICMADSQRYYLWGIVKRDNICDVSSTVTIPVVNTVNSYNFISKYLFTSNPNDQASQNQNIGGNNPNSQSFPVQNNPVPSSNQQSFPTQTNEIDTW